MLDIILEEDHPRIISEKVWLGLALVSEEKIFLNFIPPFFYFSLVAILVGSRDHRT
jgi:hypothetical protein